MADEEPEQPAEKPPEESGGAAAPKKKKAKKTTRKKAVVKPAGDEPKAEPKEPPAEEVTAEPFDATRDKGATVDMPPAGSRKKAATGSAAMAATCHVLGLADLTFGELVFGLGILAPLVLWLVLKDKDAEVDYHGKESINFQLNVLLWSLVCWILTPCCIGIPMRLALSIIEIVLVILAVIAAANRERYRYPLIYRILQ